MALTAKELKELLEKVPDDTIIHTMTSYSSSRAKHAHFVQYADGSGKPFILVYPMGFHLPSERSITILDPDKI